MANSFKYLSDHDKTVATNLLIESVFHSRSLTTIPNIGWVNSSNSPHYFVEYYVDDVSFETATRVFDITFGRSSVTTGNNSQLSAQKNIYNQFSKILLGYTTGSSAQVFNLNPDSVSDPLPLHNCIFINFSRGQFKDKIKQNTFKLKIGPAGTNATDRDFYLIDSGSDSPPETRTCKTGYVGKLFVTASNGSIGLDITTNNKVQGLIFYEAGIIALSPYIFSEYFNTAIPSNTNDKINSNKLGILTDVIDVSGSFNIQELITDKTIKDIATTTAKAIKEVSYSATTELNSTIYFCRAFNNEFNYSSNPTYLNQSKIVVKGDDPEAQPLSYITTVGLYSDDNQLLAVAKLSEPVKKTPENELIARVRLDF